MKTIFLKRMFTFTCSIAIITVTLLISGCSNNEAEIQTMEIETPFVELEYPGKWEEKVGTEWIGTDEAGTMIFSLKSEGRMDVELFLVHFNEDAQIPAGILKGENNSEVRVGITFSEPEFNDSWTDSEKDEFYAMQEDANFITRQLSNRKNFKTN